MAETLNYYELLELDPAVDDAASIEKRIQEKQRLWSRQTTEGTPRDARLAARNLKLLEDMRHALADPTERAAQAAKAKQAQEERLREARSRFSEFLGFAKGRITDVNSFILRDCGRFVRELGRPEVERLVAAAGIVNQPLKSASAPASRREGLEPATVRRIREGLTHISKKDLYEFLGLSRRCTAETLRNRAEQVNRSLLRSGQNTDQTSASKELAGQCMAIFASEESKRRYNVTLADERLDEIFIDVLPLAGRDGNISRKAMADLLAMASRQGVPVAESTAYIHTIAQRKRWTVATDDEALTTSTLPICGYCGCATHNADDVYCWNCKKKLTVECPACGASMQSSQPSCTSCGADIADTEVVEKLFDSAVRLAETQPDAALEALEQCLSRWPNWGKATSLQRDLLQKRQQQQDFSTRLVTLLRERRMYAAQQCLEQAVKVCGAHAFSRAAELVHKALADANRLVQEGERHRVEGHIHEAGQHFEKALAICVDFPAAQAALSTLPPVAAQHLEATENNAASVRLSWTPGRQDGAFVYTLTRKANTPPCDPSDGETLLTASPVTRFDDVHAAGGVCWYYSVFALRPNGTHLPPSVACSVGPVLLAPPPEDIVAQPDDQSCTITWRMPDNALYVNVWRLADPSLSSENFTVPPQGTLLTSEKNTTCVDEKLINGQPYVYALAAVYADTEAPDRQRSSRPVTCNVTPTARVDAVTDLLAFTHNEQVYATWTPPAHGNVALAFCTPPVQSSPFPAQHLAALTQLVPVTSAGQAKAALPAETALVNGKAWIAPVTVRGDMALMGSPVRLVPLEDVSNISCRPEDGRLYINWTWPEGITEVLILWSTDTPPEHANAQHCQRVLCTQAAYNENGAFIISPAPVQRHHIRICTRMPGYPEVLSDGVSITASMGLVDVVQYAVQRSGLFRKRASGVRLTSDTVTELRGLVLRAKETSVPLSIHEGVVLATIEHLRFEAGEAHIALPLSVCRSNLYIRLFFANGEHAETIRLMPAKPDELKLC